MMPASELLSYRAAFPILYPARWQAAKEAGKENSTATILYRWLEQLIGDGHLHPVVVAGRHYLDRAEAGQLAPRLTSCDRCHVPLPVVGNDGLCYRCHDYRQQQAAWQVHPAEKEIDDNWLSLRAARAVLSNCSNSWVTSLARRGLIEGRGEHGSREYSRTSIQAYLARQAEPPAPKPPKLQPAKPPRPRKPKQPSRSAQVAAMFLRAVPGDRAGEILDLTAAGRIVARGTLRADNARHRLLGLILAGKLTCYLWGARRVVLAGDLVGLSLD